MMTRASGCNRVRERRQALGLTQAELAERAGISRSAVTAIEAARLVPSVAAALAVAEALGGTVEDLFGRASDQARSEAWAWQPPSTSRACWQAEVGGKTLYYPAGSTPMLTPLPDAPAAGSAAAKETLVIACCDPAAGLLASQFAQVSGLRMLVLPRSSGQALEMLRAGLVHLAGLHLSTKDEPERNATEARALLGEGFHMLRLARWQEGIVIAPTAQFRSVQQIMRSKVTWIGREPGSGAGQCLDRLLENRPRPRRIARHHRGVVDALQSGWADAGVCIQLVSSEAGLRFLPVQEEAYDVCFSAALAEDRRFKALLRVVRSTAYRKLLNDLPGYDASETGHLWRAN